MEIDIPILLYHAVAAGNAGRAQYTVAKEVFERHLDSLQVSGYRALTLSKMLDQLSGGGLVQRSVVITFDDGLRSFYELALPALKARQMAATLIVIAGQIEESNSGRASTADRVFMTKQEIDEAAASGIEIGAHGWKHRALTDCTATETREELVRAKSELEAGFGKPISCYAYPYGKYSQAAVEAVAAAGYRGAVSVFSREVRVTSNLYTMRRINLHDGDGRMRFQFKLSSLYLTLRGRFVDRRVLQ